jgi:hypothetical protein
MLQQKAGTGNEEFCVEGYAIGIKRFKVDADSYDVWLNFVVLPGTEGSYNMKNMLLQ